MGSICEAMEVTRGVRLRRRLGTGGMNLPASPSRFLGAKMPLRAECGGRSQAGRAIGGTGTSERKAL